MGRWALWPSLPAIGGGRRWLDLDQPREGDARLLGNTFGEVEPQGGPPVPKIPGMGHRQLRPLREGRQGGHTVLG